MENTQVLGVRLDVSVIDKIKSSSNFTSLTDFTKKAIENELSNQQNLTKELTNIIKKLDTLNTKLTEQKVSDIEMKLHIIYEGIKKQNEILKMIHRRTTLAANFAMHTLDDLKQSTEFRSKEHKELILIVEEEVKKIGF